jgi:hypothetical protein
MTSPTDGAAPTSPGLNPNGERRSSFNFLRQQSKNGNKMIKKQKGQSQHQQQAANIPRVPPQLPSHSPLPKINSFGGENGRPDSYAILSNQYSNSQQHGTTQHYNNGNGSMSPHAVPMPPMPSSPPSAKHGEYDPYSRTESMTHRGRYSYASSAVSTATGINSPRRVRRRKDPTPFK